MKELIWIVIIGLICGSAIAGKEMRYGTPEYWQWYSSVRQTQEGLFDPLTLGPSGAYATHRFRTNNNGGEYILRLRGSVTGEIDVWDIEKGTNNYKTSSTGDWIDGSGETWYVVNWYDQITNLYAFNQTFASNQPIFTFNSRNGEGSLGKQTTTTTATLNDIFINPLWSTYIDADLGYFFTTAYFDQNGTTVTAASTYLLNEFIKGSVAYLGIFRGDRVPGGDQIYIYNWDSDSSDRYQGTGTYLLQTWYALGWQHTNDELYAWSNKTRYGPKVTADVYTLSTRIDVYFSNPEVGGYHFTDSTMILFYDHLLTINEIEKIVDYCNAH